MMFSFIWLAAAIATACHAQVASYCATNDVCFKVNVPDASAASGNGDLYFQIQGPSSSQYIGLGQGGSMSGSNIFLVYADASGSNVTLSPRLGHGNFQPDYDSSTQISLLAGSGIANGQMTANVRCSNCASWSGGKMDFSSSNTDWIWAVKDGSSVSSDSLTANLQQHSEQGSFNFDLTKARGGNSLNPFVDTAVTNTAAGGSSPTSGSSPAGAQQSGTNNYGGSSGGSSGGGAYASIESNFAKRNKAAIAHGIIMGIAFTLLFPSGSLLIRLFSFRGLVWVHAAFQIFAYVLAIVGLALGVYIAVWPVQVKGLIGTYHPIIGLVVVALLLFQPILGLIHHNIYKARHVRTFWATAHVWFGRAVITLGIIDGGLGLKLSDNSRKAKVAYGIIAGVMWWVWMMVVLSSYYKRYAHRDRVGETGEKAIGGLEDSPRSEGSPYWQEARNERSRINRHRV